MCNPVRSPSDGSLDSFPKPAQGWSYICVVEILRERGTSDEVLLLEVVGVESIGSASRSAAWMGAPAWSSPA
jgi:hypothetical protein